MTPVARAGRFDVHGHLVVHLGATLPAVRDNLQREPLLLPSESRQRVGHPPINIKAPWLPPRFRGGEPKRHLVERCSNVEPAPHILFQLETASEYHRTDVVLAFETHLGTEVEVFVVV